MGSSPGIRQAGEPVFVQAFTPERAIETLDTGVPDGHQYPWHVTGRDTATCALLWVEGFADQLMQIQERAGPQA